MWPYREGANLLSVEYHCLSLKEMFWDIGVLCLTISIMEFEVRGKCKDANCETGASGGSKGGEARWAIAPQKIKIRCTILKVYI
jgi:hypothetical protein